jgi:hypothetical protein
VLSRARHKFKERDLKTFCDRCQADRNVSDCITKADTEVRTYKCPECDQILILVGIPSDRSFTGEDTEPASWWSIRPRSVLTVRLANSELSIPGGRESWLYGEPLL